ncbi:MAG: XDD3 family exosortase-dependent surface protein, partial [Candidatus Parabeggiatoa sp.]|nr:XDD3 family exosortase-dependent surface protein [Candidatus Parabeggiatoa sp.]
GGLSDTQIVTIGSSGVERLDPDGFHPGLDIEGLDVSTQGEVYASSGDDGDLPGHLYQIDHETGTVYGIGDICFDFRGQLVCGTEVSAISFNPTDNSLWGWSEECGLVQINMANPRQSDLIFSHATDDFVACLSDDNRVRRAYSSYVEDMTWNNNGSLLYYADRSKVFSYDPATENVTKVAEVGGNVEAIEMLPEFDDKLLLNRHNSPTLTVLDLTDGTSYPSHATVGEFNDIEAIGTCLGDNIEPPLCVMVDAGWMYTKDSINDSTGTSPEFGVVRVGNAYFEIYGIAVRVDKDTVTVALNSRLPLGGVPYHGTLITWGDIVFDFDGTKYGVRFDATNDSLGGGDETGLYEVTELKSVSKANKGHTNFSTYESYVTQRSGEPSLGDMPNLNNGYFGNTAPIPTSIKTGIKVANDGFEMLDATQLAAKGLDFATNLGIPASAYDPSNPYSSSNKKPANELGEYTVGFSFNRQDDMTGAFKAFIFTECGNDGILMNNSLPSCL